MGVTMSIVEDMVREIMRLKNGLGSIKLDNTIDYITIMEKYNVGINTARAILQVLEKKLIEMGIEAKYERGKLRFRIEKEDRGLLK